MCAEKEDIRTMRWREKLPFIVHAMVLANETLFVAGPVEGFLRSPDSYTGDSESVVWAISARDGKKISECALKSPPVFDGMAAAYGKLYIALKNGTVTCLGE